MAYRNKTVQTRLSDEEFARIAKLAKKHNMPVSSWLRDRGQTEEAAQPQPKESST
jgi:hypothetical protein